MLPPQFSERKKSQVIIAVIYKWNRDVLLRDVLLVHVIVVVLLLPLLLWKSGEHVMLAERNEALRGNGNIGAC